MLLGDEIESVRGGRGDGTIEGGGEECTECQLTQGLRPYGKRVGKGHRESICGGRGRGVERGSQEEGVLYKCEVTMRIASPSDKAI